METGPNLLPLLSDILLRFRRHKIAICADIEKAFLQVSIRPEDRDAHRFFWMVDDVVRTMRITRVPFGNRASPFLLNATVRHHLSLYPSSKTVIQELSLNMYCDDWLSGGDNKEDVIALMSEASEIMNKAKMTLSKWSSNSEEVAECIQRCFQDKTVEIKTVKVLGIRWLPKEDVFTFDGMIISEDLMITKRVILSFIARTFDPLGLISPFTITAKILFQDIWKVGLDWDEEVSDEIRNSFSRWIKDLSILKELSIPRCYVSLTWADKQTIELHCFCDSSLKGYGAVTYLKVIELDGSVTVTLLMSKARVAPLKPVTLPRLELLGAVIAAKLLHAVMKALLFPEGTKYFCWTDSTVALQCSEPTRWKMFVSNRVVQIQELTSPDCWHHCSGKDNPADCLTRGMTAAELMHNPLWFRGPQWLNGPMNRVNQSDRCSDTTLSEELVSMSDVNVYFSKTSEVLSPEWWGDFSKAVRVIAWLFRFVNNTKHKDSSSNSDSLSTEELVFASQNCCGTYSVCILTMKLEVSRKVCV